MNLSNLIIVAVLILVIIFYLYQKGIIFANFENITPKEAYTLIKKEKKDIVILDVRTPEEVKTEGKIPNSILIPLGTLSRQIDKLKKYKNKKIIVYCRSGNRSVAASRLLKSLGFNNVYNLKGGIINWKKQNLPVK